MIKKFIQFFFQSFPSLNTAPMERPSSWHTLFKGVSKVRNSLIKAIILSQRFSDQRCLSFILDNLNEKNGGKLRRKKKRPQSAVSECPPSAPPPSTGHGWPFESKWRLQPQPGALARIPPSSRPWKRRTPTASSPLNVQRPAVAPLSLAC